MGTDPGVGIRDSPAAGHDPRHDAHQDLLHDQWSPRVAQTDALVPEGERADDVLVHEASVENVVPRPALVVADDFRLQELQLTWEVVTLVLQGESLRGTGANQREVVRQTLSVVARMQQDGLTVHRVPHLVQLSRPSHYEELLWAQELCAVGGRHYPRGVDDGATAKVTSGGQTQRHDVRDLALGSGRSAHDSVVIQCGCIGGRGTWGSD